MHEKPSLAELAARHAARRWPKKKRNADLRRWGYEPDGAHGATYRAAFAQACQTDRLARATADMGAEASVTFLWDVPAAEWPEWIAQGCGDLPLTEYRQRLAAVRARIESQGGAVVMASATVADVLATIAELGLANDPAGRAAALAILGARNL